MSLLQENGSTLTSIIGSLPNKLTESFELSSGSLPAQFHEKFWGKSMADEEQKWRDTQLPMPIEGAGLGNEHQGGDEPTDVDVGEEWEESDDDIIEGCHFLEIDIKGFAIKKIWIRAEYIRIYEVLEARYQMPLYPNTAGAVVVTGQPGIGKSIWIYYALRRRLAEKKSIIWYYEGTRYLFVEEGVYKVPDGFRRFKGLVWT